MGNQPAHFIRKPVGLTGGIATGKSTVAAIFQELGAQVIDGDEVAASILTPNSPALKALKEKFGARIILSNGALNRRLMLDILRADPELLPVQLQILSPFILPEIDRIAGETMRRYPDRLVIVEAPLLFEYGKSDRYRPIVVVYAPFSVQVGRLMSRSGKSRKWAE
jgi:dephospho-CoA kinase